jgi:WD40 repeat protein
MKRADSSGSFSDEPLTGPIVVVGCKNSTVRIWKLPNAVDAPKASSSPNYVIRGHASRVHTLTVYGYKGDTYIATACRDFNIRCLSI